jgi:glycosyltransferase involved in cell wall biosynthesis
MMYIILLIGSIPPSIGGVTIHTLRLYKWLEKEKNIDIKISSLNKTDIENANIKYVGNYLIWILNKIIFGFKEDIVHYQGANYFGLTMLYIVNILHPNFKLILSVHGEGYVGRLEKRQFLKKIIYFILNRLDLIIASKVSPNRWTENR